MRALEAWCTSLRTVSTGVPRATRVARATHFVRRQVMMCPAPPKGATRPPHVTTRAVRAQRLGAHACARCNIGRAARATHVARATHFASRQVMMCLALRKGATRPPHVTTRAVRALERLGAHRCARRKHWACRARNTRCARNALCQ